MNAATQWFKFDPLFIGTPMKGEWCLWSFVTKHGRECYSGRWIVHEGADLIVTDRGWSVPLVVGEAYFARVIPLDKIPSASRRADAAAYSAGGARRAATTPSPINQKYAPGTRVRIADDLGSAMRHFPKGRMATVRYTYAHAFGGDDVKSYCLDVDGIGETSWYREDQLTAASYCERMKIGEPAQTMIEDAGEPSTFVQDGLADIYGSNEKCAEVLEGGHTHICEYHESAEHEAQNWKPATHTWQGLGMVVSETDHLVNQRCPQHRRKHPPKFPPNISIREGDQPK